MPCIVYNYECVVEVYILKCNDCLMRKIIYIWLDIDIYAMKLFLKIVRFFSLHVLYAF